MPGNFEGATVARPRLGGSKPVAGYPGAASLLQSRHVVWLWALGIIALSVATFWLYRYSPYSAISVFYPATVAIALASAHAGSRPGAVRIGFTIYVGAAAAGVSLLASDGGVVPGWLTLLPFLLGPAVAGLAICGRPWPGARFVVLALASTFGAAFAAAVLADNPNSGADGSHDYIWSAFAAATVLVFATCLFLRACARRWLTR